MSLLNIKKTSMVINFKIKRIMMSSFHNFCLKNQLYHLFNVPHPLAFCLITFLGSNTRYSQKKRNWTISPSCLLVTADRPFHFTAHQPKSHDFSSPCFTVQNSLFFFFVITELTGKIPPPPISNTGEGTA